MKVNPILILLALSGLHFSATAQTVSPVQSAARPFNLDIAGLVQVAGSDEASKAFQKDVLPDMLKFVDRNLREYQKLGGKSLKAMALDPSKLTLAFDTAARVYFIGEGAAFRNSLGISTTGQGPLSKDAELIFPNASNAEGVGRSTREVRTQNDPLLAGDFVDLGVFKQGTQLEFFIVANGANQGREVFSTNVALNHNKLVHAVSLAPDGSPYLLIGFEDLRGGGDQDYNDLVFAVFLGEKNLQKLSGLGAPEPTLAAGSLLALATVFGRKRRR